MKIFYGPKGTGKTKAIVSDANSAIEKAKGLIIFVTDTNKYSLDLKHEIRLLNVTDFKIQNADGLRGFLKGIVASNGDTEYIFVDGLARIAGKQLAELEDLFVAMEELESAFGVKFALTCSSAKEDLPNFIAKHID